MWCEMREKRPRLKDTNTIECNPTAKCDKYHVISAQIWFHILHMISKHILQATAEYTCWHYNTFHLHDHEFPKKSILFVWNSSPHWHLGWSKHIQIGQQLWRRLVDIKTHTPTIDHWVSTQLRIILRIKETSWMFYLQHKIVEKSDRHLASRTPNTWAGPQNRCYNNSCRNDLDNVKKSLY